MDILKYEPEVTLILKKYAKANNVDDMRQDCWAALLTAKTIDGPGHAYTIMRNRVVDLYFRKQPPVLETFDDVAEQQWNDMTDRLAIEEALVELTTTEAKLVMMYYGIGQSPKTEEQISKVFKKSRSWVHKNKQLTLIKLRGIIGDKHGKR